MNATESTLQSIIIKLLGAMNTGMANIKSGDFQLNFAIIIFYLLKM